MSSSHKQCRLSWTCSASCNVQFDNSLTMLIPLFLSPDLISRLRNTGIFASSPHGAPNHIILNEVIFLRCSIYINLPYHAVLAWSRNYGMQEYFLREILCSINSILITGSHTRMDQPITLWSQQSRWALTLCSITINTKQPIRKSKRRLLIVA